MSFPEESRPALGALYPMFYKNLADIIPSVRQGAALSLANVVRSFGESALIDVVSYLQNGLRVSWCLIFLVEFILPLFSIWLG